MTPWLTVRCSANWAIEEYINVKDNSFNCRLWHSSLTGNYLLSQAVSHQVSSTWKSLTSVFGMGTGGSSLLSSPDSLKVCTFKTKQCSDAFLWFLTRERLTSFFSVYISVWFHTSFAKLRLVLRTINSCSWFLLRKIPLRRLSSFYGDVFLRKTS